jgi:hypothetical protein
MELLSHLATTTLNTILDVLPIAAILLFFQVVVVRQRPPHLGRLLIGFAYVLIGLALFLVGLEEALFPLGEIMAKQLTDPAFITGGGTLSGEPFWGDYLWVYAFAACIGFATTIAEPSLIVVALKASSVSGGAVSVWGLRLTVAVGVAVGVSLGAFRIVTGTPLHFYIAAGYVIVVVQTIYSNKDLVPLAYDSGGVTTSTVTVPLVTALGLGLASTIPGRNTVIDGFGLIAFASLFPMMSVLAYAQISTWRRQRSLLREKGERDET